MATVRRIAVYCASSDQVHGDYLAAAAGLGRLLARERIAIVYGGGGSGLMGALADASLAEGGEVVGVIPRFMDEIEWGHAGLTELHIVEDMHERKRRMLDDADAVVALPGGTGTLEELLEAITLKRLGLFLSPIVLVNIRGFYDPLLRQFDEAITQRFMDERHRLMWRVAERTEDVLAAIRDSPPWDAGARAFARI